MDVCNNILYMPYIFHKFKNLQRFRIFPNNMSVLIRGPGTGYKLTQNLTEKFTKSNKRRMMGRKWVRMKGK